MRQWSALQFEMLTPWDSVRHDAVTLNLALEYMASEKPRFLYIALGETDDWAHNRRYDRKVEFTHYFDEALKRIWTAIQSNRAYRGKTTLIVTTDHGRGRTPRDWTNHGEGVEGANEAWLCVFGPDVKKVGEMKGGPEYSLSNVAGTMLAVLGIDSKEYDSGIAPAVAETSGK